MISIKVKKFLEEIKKDLGFLPDDLHITRKDCSLAAVSKGSVIRTEKAKVCHYPLFSKLFSFNTIDKRYN